jgi:hypothetical protein
MEGKRASEEAGRIRLLVMDVPGWDNKRIEREGGAAYLDAQRLLRERYEAERDQQNEEVALAQFTERFVAAGGERTQAARAFKAARALGYAREPEEGDIVVAGHQYLNKLSSSAGSLYLPCGYTPSRT